MKRLLKIFIFAGSCLAFAAGTFSSAGTESAVCRQQKSDFAAALAECRFIANGERLKSDAEYFLLLYSASWCGPCRNEAPVISKTYREEIKQNPAVELVMMSCDSNEKQMLGWAAREGMEFPITLVGRFDERILTTPVKPPRGIPHLYIFKADGTLLKDGHPAKIFKDYKKYTIQQ